MNRDALQETLQTFESIVTFAASTGRELMPYATIIAPDEAQPYIDMAQGWLNYSKAHNLLVASRPLCDPKFFKLPVEIRVMILAVEVSYYVLLFFENIISIDHLLNIAEKHLCHM